MFSRNRMSIFIISYFLFALIGNTETITQLTNLPQPALGSYFITSAPLKDGTFLIWNGNQVYKETSPKSDNYSLIASDYLGDPAFITVSPDEQKVVLGQGYQGNLYLLNLNNPQDFTPSSIIANLPHYYGIFLTPDLLLLDITKSDFSGSEIHILPVNTKSNHESQLVLTRPQKTSKDLVIDKPPYAYSATLAIANNWVYIMDGNARELRKFSTSALINAYNSHTTLDWETDGTLIGNPGIYFTGGVLGVTIDNRLLIAGSEGFMLPGGIQEVDATTGAVIQIWDPANNQGYYSAFYNPYSDTILAIINNTGYLIVRTEQETCPDCSPIRKSMYRVGENICLDLFGVEVPSDTTFIWSKVGTDIINNPRISGIHCKNLLIYNAQAEDSGTYICAYNNQKATYTIQIIVTDKALPLSNPYLFIALTVFLITTALIKIRYSNL
ncbi:MAG TPA: immunoglobulin domain-containing protein [Candidatus Hydrogenedens sp.]|nr:immunoglobulin domain-containing protein [Candidatus Hydrogenedens sp.]